MKKYGVWGIWALLGVGYLYLTRTKQGLDFWGKLKTAGANYWPTSMAATSTTAQVVTNPDDASQHPVVQNPTSSSVDAVSIPGIGQPFAAT